MSRAYQHSKKVEDGIVRLLPVIATLRQRGAVLLDASAGLGTRERPVVSIASEPPGVIKWLRAQGAEVIWRGTGKDGAQIMYRHTLVDVDVEWLERI